MVKRVEKKVDILLKEIGTLAETCKGFLAASEGSRQLGRGHKGISLWECAAMDGRLMNGIATRTEKEKCELSCVSGNDS